MSPWDGEDYPPDTKQARIRRWVLQGLFAAALVAAVYLVETSTNPQWSAARDWVQTAMTENFDFASVSQWYAQQLDGSPSILPAFEEFRRGVPVNTGTDGWVAIEGKILRPYSEKQDGVLLSKQPGEVIHAASEGWVLSVDESPSLGLTVVIQHAGDRRTWYALLGESLVKRNDWVQAGQPIAKVGEEGQVFLALSVGEKFVDPHLLTDAE